MKIELKPEVKEYLDTTGYALVTRERSLRRFNSFWYITNGGNVVESAVIDELEPFEKDAIADILIDELKSNLFHNREFRDKFYELFQTYSIKENT